MNWHSICSNCNTGFVCLWHWNHAFTGSEASSADKHTQPRQGNQILCSWMLLLPLCCQHYHLQWTRLKKWSSWKLPEPGSPITSASPHPAHWNNNIGIRLFTLGAPRSLSFKGDSVSVSTVGSNSVLISMLLSCLFPPKDAVKIKNHLRISETFS